MAYQNTSATDVSDLLDKLYTFATVTESWTGVYNEVTAAGPPEIRQIAMEISNCHLAMGTRDADLGLDKSGETDGYTSAALSSSLDSGPPYQYHSHPDSIVTSETDTDRIRCNDLGEPPFTNVWFFSGDGVGDVDYIHMVVQTAGERYSHFSVGIIDPVGQTHAEVAFCCSMYWEWWLSSFINNIPEDDTHKCGYFWGDDEEGQVFIPYSVSDPVLPAGFQDVSPNGLPFNGNNLTKIRERLIEDSDDWRQAAGRILDFLQPSYNQPTTGGTLMWGLPMLFRDTGSPRSHIMLGVLPGMRYARIDDVAPGTTLTYGTEEWVIFPFKRKGLRENVAASAGGSDPVDLINTIEWAFAYKKNT